MLTSHNHAIYVEEQSKVGSSILPALCNTEVADIKMTLTTVYTVLNEGNSKFTSLQNVDVGVFTKYSSQHVNRTTVPTTIQAE